MDHMSSSVEGLGSRALLLAMLAGRSAPAGPPGKSSLLGGQPALQLAQGALLQVQQWHALKTVALEACVVLGGAWSFSGMHERECVLLVLPLQVQAHAASPLA
eukprot:scaffold203720_cov19-Tisochrysis_lutea.AAC.1